MRYGLATALMSQGVGLDVVAGDELDGPEFRNSPRVRFLNLRRDQRPDASVPAKVSRVLLDYGRLVRYARPRGCRSSTSSGTTSSRCSIAPR